MPKDIKLSPNFWLSELIKSGTATRLGIDNWPKEDRIINNLKGVANKVLQPVRNHYGMAFAPNSGYRCLALNNAVNSKPSSQHVQGQAVDFELAGIDNYKLAVWCEKNLDFDQLILEFYVPGDPRSGWVHCSYVSAGKNRHSVITISKGKVHVGLKN